MKKITTPVSEEEILSLDVGDQISISGIMYTGRDAALPQLVELIIQDKLNFNIEGSAIMHTAVSNAGIAPTTSNKEDKVIEKKCVLFENEGIEAFYRLKVENIPGIVAVSNGKSI